MTEMDLSSSTSSSTGGQVSSFDGEFKRRKGAILFTGPDGMKDHKVKVEDQYYIGHTTASPEATADLSYICRAAKNCPHPPPKTSRVGEVGWGVAQFTDYSILKTGHQIQLKEFRQANEDRYTHRYQAPYYPMGSDAMHQGDFYPIHAGISQQQQQDVATVHSGSHPPEREGSDKNSTSSALSLNS